MIKQIIEIYSLLITILCWIHYYFYSSKKLSRVIVFFTGAMLLGGIAEAAAILTTGSYNYPGFLIYTGPVPLYITLSWGTTFYIIYRIANRLAKSWGKSRFYFIVFAITAGLTGLLLDLNYDPVAVSLGLWVWENGSAYYGVPVGNFSGWFIFSLGFCTAYKYIYAKEIKEVRKAVYFYLSLVLVFIVTIITTLPFLK